MTIDKLNKIGSYKGSKLIAVLCSDIHLSAKPPVARSAESPSWFHAMKRPLDEVREISEFHDVPIVCAGDVFDKWKSPPQLINFALDHLPEMWSIPGQHDLPYHSYEDLQASAYYTLQRISLLKKIKTDGPTEINDNLVLHGFPWGFPIKPLPAKNKDGRVHLAVIHAYNWYKESKYPGAPKEENLSAYKRKLRGYDCAVFGDNHKGFIAKAGDCTVINTGGFMRRTIAEKNYEPKVGLLFRDGGIKRLKLDCSKDKFIEGDKLKEAKKNSMDTGQFIEELQQIGDTAINFKENLKHYLKHTKGPAKEILKMLIEEE